MSHSNKLREPWSRIHGGIRGTRLGTVQCLRVAAIVSGRELGRGCAAMPAERAPLEDQPERQPGDEPDKHRLGRRQDDRRRRQIGGALRDFPADRTICRGIERGVSVRRGRRGHICPTGGGRDRRAGEMVVGLRNEALPRKGQQHGQQHGDPASTKPPSRMGRARRAADAPCFSRHNLRPVVRRTGCGRPAMLHCYMNQARFVAVHHSAGL